MVKKRSNLSKGVKQDESMTRGKPLRSPPAAEATSKLPKAPIGKGLRPKSEYSVVRLYMIYGKCIDI